MPVSKQMKTRIVQMITESGCNVETLMQDFRQRCISGRSMHSDFSPKSKFLTESTKSFSEKEITVLVDRTIGGLYGMGISPDVALPELAYYLENHLNEWHPLQAAGNVVKNVWNRFTGKGQTAQNPGTESPTSPPSDEWMSNLAKEPVKKATAIPMAQKIDGPQASATAGAVDASLQRIQQFDMSKFLNRVVNDSIDQKTGVFDVNKFNGGLRQLSDYVNSIDKSFSKKNINTPGFADAINQIKQSAESLKSNVSKVAQTQSEKVSQLQQQAQQAQQEFKNQQNKIAKFTSNMSRWIGDAAKPDMATIQKAMKQLTGSVATQNKQYQDKPYTDPSNAYGVSKEPLPPRPQQYYPQATAPANSPVTDFAHTDNKGMQIAESTKIKRKSIYDW
jgi:archaellum component FlaC